VIDIIKDVGCHQSRADDHLIFLKECLAEYHKSLENSIRATAIYSKNIESIVPKIKILELWIRQRDSVDESQKTVWVLKSTSEYANGYTIDKIYYQRPNDEKVMTILEDNYSSDLKHIWKKQGPNSWRAGITTVVLEKVEIE